MAGPQVPNAIARGPKTQGRRSEGVGVEAKGKETETMTSKAISDLIGLEENLRMNLEMEGESGFVPLMSEKIETILAAISAIKSLPVADGRKEGLEMAAKACENVSFGLDVTWWLEATKKEVSAESCRQCAAAIRSLIASPHEVVPSGWVMVPREPTREMLDAGLAECVQYGGENFFPAPSTAYRAMLSAAPSAPAVKGDEAMIEKIALALEPKLRGFALGNMPMELAREFARAALKAMTQGEG